MEFEDAIDPGQHRQADGSARADELRASLIRRLDVETLLAEAGATRQAAVRDADVILAEAQRVAADLRSDSGRESERRAVAARAESDEIISRARADAEAIRNRAEADVEDYRRRVREELTQQVAQDVAERARADLIAVRDQSEAMIGDLAASVRILGVALSTAQTNVGEMLAALDELRVHAVEGIRVSSPLPRYAAAADELGGEPVDRVDEGAGSGADDDPPTSAMDAYLRLAHVDFGDPPLPAVDDSEVGTRYARDAQRGRDSPSIDQAYEAGPDVEPGADPDLELDRQDDDTDSTPPSTGDAGKPLGWLFRSAT